MSKTGLHWAFELVTEKFVRMNWTSLVEIVKGP